MGWCFVIPGYCAHFCHPPAGWGGIFQPPRAPGAEGLLVSAQHAAGAIDETCEFGGPASPGQGSHAGMVAAQAAICGLCRGKPRL